MPPFRFPFLLTGVPLGTARLARPPVVLVSLGPDVAGSGAFSVSLAERAGSLVFAGAATAGLDERPVKFRLAHRRPPPNTLEVAG